VSVRAVKTMRCSIEGLGSDAANKTSFNGVLLNVKVTEWDEGMPRCP